MPRGETCVYPVMIMFLMIHQPTIRKDRGFQGGRGNRGRIEGVG